MDAERLTDIEPEKTCGSGFLWWGGFLFLMWAVGAGKSSLALGSVYPVWGLWNVVGLCLGAGACLLWYSLCRTRKVAGVLRRVLGGLLFAFGSGSCMYLGNSLLPVLQVARDQGVPPSPATISFTAILFLMFYAVVFLLPSYVLCFRRVRRTEPQKSNRLSRLSTRTADRA